MTQPFSVLNAAEVAPTSKVMDDLEFRFMLDRKVAAVKALVEGGLRATTRPPIKNLKTGTRYSDDPTLPYLVAQERLKHATRKALKNLRERLSNLKLIRVLGSCGFWSEFIWLRQEIGVRNGCYLDGIEIYVIELQPNRIRMGFSDFCTL